VLVAHAREINSNRTVAREHYQSLEAVEDHCNALVRRDQFLQCRDGEWPDGTVAARYGFVHALYQKCVRANLRQ